eukprot:4390279-Prymnesium_polylepis.1
MRCPPRQLRARDRRCEAVDAARLVAAQLFLASSHQSRESDAHARRRSARSASQHAARVDRARSSPCPPAS